MRRLLFAKIELWIVGLLALLGLILAVMFGAAVLDAARGGDRLGALGRAALALAEAPWTARRLLSEGHPLAAAGTDRFAGRAGWTFRDPPAAAGPGGFLLLSRYDGDRGSHVVELYDLAARQVRFTWAPDATVLLADARRDSAITDFTRWNRFRFRAIHPLLLADGSLILKDHETPLIRMDGCGRALWRQEADLFHHSTETGPDGNLYVPSRIEPSALPGFPADYSDDAITVLSPAGEILAQRSVTDLLLAQGYAHLVYNARDFHRDAIHLNDIEPVLEDGRYWRRGDLFLSLRTRSAVLLYRPSEDRILWLQQGPWLGQHDVDILDGTRIAIFNNNSYDTGRGGRVLGFSEISVYDFATGAVTSPWRAALESAAVRTVFEGLQAFLPGGHVLVEEENAGRLLILAPDGTVAAEFVNRAADGTVYRLGWSRHVPQPLAAAALAALAGQACGG